MHDVGICRGYSTRMGLKWYKPGRELRKQVDDAIALAISEERSRWVDPVGDADNARSITFPEP
jgi:hypothetical protein